MRDEEKKEIDKRHGRMHYINCELDLKCPFDPVAARETEAGDSQVLGS
jgi:hypothetical protein